MILLIKLSPEETQHIYVGGMEMEEQFVSFANMHLRRELL